MICAGTACNKKLKGGFKQANGTFLCAACVLGSINTRLVNMMASQIQDSIDRQLKSKSRPTKRYLKYIRSQIEQLRS